MLAETRGGGAAAAANITTTSDRREAGHVMSSTTAADPRTGGMVSIMVMYRPPTGQAAAQGPDSNKTVDLPPTYDSLFLEAAPEAGAAPPPPGYNMLTVNLAQDAEAAVASGPSLQVVAVDATVAEADTGEAEAASAPGPSGSSLKQGPELIDISGQEAAEAGAAAGDTDVASTSILADVDLTKPNMVEA